MVHHAAQVIVTCMVGADGLTPFRRLKGRKFGTPLASFGERVWFRDPILERANKFNPRCTEARLLGFSLKSSRYIVVDFDGRFRMARTIKDDAEDLGDNNAEVPKTTSESAPSNLPAEAASSSSAPTPSVNPALPASAAEVLDQVMSEGASSSSDAAVRLSMKRSSDNSILSLR